MWLNKTTKVCEQDSSVLFDISIIPSLSLSPSLLPSYHSSLHSSLPSFSFAPPPPPLLPSFLPSLPRSLTYSLTHSLTPSLPSFLPPFLTLPPTLIQKTNKQKNPAKPSSSSSSSPPLSSPPPPPPPPTPHYNAALLSEMGAQERHLHLLHASMEGRPAMADAVVLCKVWAKQRELDKVRIVIRYRE